jgi:hypothetical protein
LFFTILDYTGSATRNFADSDFDGEPPLITEEEIDEDGNVTEGDEWTPDPTPDDNDDGRTMKIQTNPNRRWRWRTKTKILYQRRNCFNSCRKCSNFRCKW